MKKRYLRKIDLKNQIWGRPGEDFSCHQHFRKQEYYFFGLTFQSIAELC